MNETKPTSPQDPIDVRQLARAIRFALAVLVLGLSYLSLRASLSIGGFSQIFADMLNGQPLPALTRLVLGAAPLFVAVSILVPIAVVATLFLRSVVGSFYIIGVLGFVTLSQFIVLYVALTTPLSQIVRAMGAMP